MIHEELSGAIIGAAMAVLNELGPGLDEKIYERALVIELRKRGHQVEQQKSFAVHYSGELVGTLIPDTIVDGLVIADPKVVETFAEKASKKRRCRSALARDGCSVARRTGGEIARKRAPTLRVEWPFSTPSGTHVCR